MVPKFAVFSHRYMELWAETTANKQNIDKVTVMKKLMKNEKQCALIQDIGLNKNLSERFIAVAKTFAKL